MGLDRACTALKLSEDAYQGSSSQILSSEGGVPNELASSRAFFQAQRSTVTPSYVPMLTSLSGSNVSESQIILLLIAADINLHQVKKIVRINAYVWSSVAARVAISLVG